MKVAYIRVSSSSQSLDIQRQQMEKEGISKIFEEKVSGTSTQGREKLREMLDFVREGDCCRQWPSRENFYDQSFCAR